MRRWIGIFALIISACGGGSSTNNGLTPQLINFPDLSSYEDYGVQMSADGLRAAFLSRREAGSFRVYLHEQAATSNPKRLADLVALGENEQERRFALSKDGQWILVERQSSTAHYLLLSRWDGQATLRIELGLNDAISDLSFALNSDPMIAYALGQGANLTVKVVQVSISGSTLTPTERGSFAGEKRPIFSELSGGVPLLFTETPASSGSNWKARTYAASTQTWSDRGSPFLIAGKDPKISATGRGLIYAQTLTTIRTKTKLGTNEVKPENYVPFVGVLDSLFQFDPSSGTAIDFAASSYRALEPLTISSLSASSDGAYILLTGSETYFCKTSAPNFNSMLLVRTSDMSAVPLFVSRPTGQANWSEVMSSPCSYFDEAAPAVTKEFNNRIVQASLAGTDGVSFRIAFESDFTKDREVYRLEVKVDDWTQKTLSGVVLNNLSNNSRP